MGWDNIPIRIINDGIDSIAGPLSNHTNHAISTNTVPKYWKFGQITPVFKKGVEYSKTNYRPITVLVAFNNVFERILVNQLYSYLSDKLSPFLSAYRKYYSCETSLLRMLEETRPDTAWTSDNFHRLSELICRKHLIVYHMICC